MRHPVMTLDHVHDLKKYKVQEYRRVPAQFGEENSIMAYGLRFCYPVYWQMGNEKKIGLVR